MKIANSHIVTDPRVIKDDAPPFAHFLKTIFGDGATDGLLVVADERGSTVQTRDPGEIAEFLTGAKEGWVSPQTRDNDGKRYEQPAVCAPIRDKLPPPNIVMAHEDGTRSGVWLIDTVDLRKTTLPEDLTDAMPLAGYGGWRAEIVDATTIHKLEDLKRVLAPPKATAQSNELVVHGEIDPAILGREIEIAIGQNKEAKRWLNKKTTFGRLLNRLTRHEAGAKDGEAFVAGRCIDGKRQATAIQHLDLLVIDVDVGQHISEIRARLQEVGLFGCIYSTHSHMKPITEIRLDTIAKHCGTTAPNAAQVCEYLTTVRRYRPWVLEGAELLPNAHTAEGIMVRVKHKPMPKFRVVLILKDRFTIANRGGTQREAIEEWKGLYRGTSRALGAYYDRTCVDPSRLYFTPRRPQDAIEWCVEIIAGEPLDLEAVERVSEQDVRDEGKSEFEKAADKMRAGSGDDYKTPGLWPFIGKCANTFEISQFLLDRDPDGDRGERNGGRVHRCPNEGAHSNAGDDQDVAFWCKNAEPGGDGFVATCRHDNCQGLDRVKFLDLACQQLGIADAKELIEWVPQTEEDDEEQQQASTSDGGKKSRKARKGDAEADLEETLQQFHTRWHFVGEGATGRYVGGEARNGDLEFKQEGALIRLYEDQSIIRTDDNGRSRRINPVREWLSRPEFADHRHTGLCFLPGQPQSACEPYFNEWRGFAIEPREGRWDRMKEHIFEVLCAGNDRDYQWIMAWMAHVLQNVGNLRKKLTISPVIRGVEGAGKSTVFDALRAILGKRHGIVLSRSEQAIGRFNAPLALALLTQLEEAFFAGDPRINGPLKDLLTGKDMLLERKGIDATPVHNYSHFVIISNSERPVPIDGFSRRYYPIECSDHKANQEAWFDPIFAEMSAEAGLAAMAWELLHWQPPGGDWKLLRRFPQTEAGNRMIAEGLSWCERFVLTFAWRGSMGYGADSVALPELDHATIATADLAKQFAAWADEKETNPRLRDRIKTDAKTVGETLRRMLPALDRAPDTSIKGRVFPDKERVLEMLRMHKNGGYRAFLDALDEDGE